MDQEKSKLIITRLAFSHSESVSRLITSMAMETYPTDSNAIQSRNSKLTISQRLPLSKIMWIMNRSISL